MYGDPRDPPNNQFKVIVLLLIAVVAIIGVTYALNGGGGKPAEAVENNTTADNNTTATSSIQPKMIGNNSNGSVVKYATYGSNSSNVRIALIIGVGENTTSDISVIPTLENVLNAKYAYDVYLVNTTLTPDKVSNNTSDNDTNETSDNDTNTSDNNTTTKSSSASADKIVANASANLARDYAVPDIVNNSYDLAVQIQSSSNGSYMFVPSDNTYTSKIVLNNVSNASGISKGVPNNYDYVYGASLPLIGNNTPSFVYATSTYYSSQPSDEVQMVIAAIDGFDFNGYYSALENQTFVDDSNSSDSNNTTANNTTSSTTMKTSSEVED